ncbi:endonuclease III [Latilactobacillus fuchuensis]|uniref:Endonuclease III n=1 Tax=Latilactobacillus fuchuensis DSM 14340 = JCM 11249 TaxID=1423747 RepID=A0A0R1S5Y8_9LACO|nr:endonuclease III [Latilactobacillus fuchuensis]KRL62098.1 endonuclease III [Latilactobacillus fuchuensis DSM 14340 = JCM 11249]MCP8856957.1 endonuclease III [Latilactobacillus fuchuensis]
MLSKTKTRWAFDQLYTLIPDAKGALVADSPFQLLIAVMLSAQATDVSVNKVTPKLFRDFPTPTSFANASLESIEVDIHSIGLYHNKAKHIKTCCQQLIADFGGEVPQTHAELEQLAGVGRKTANVVLGDAFNVPSFAVDTHVTRIAKRLRISAQNASVIQIERDFQAKLPESDWVKAHHTLILFGRQYCTARNPKCQQCPLLTICAAGQQYLADRG